MQSRLNVIDQQTPSYRWEQVRLSRTTTPFAGASENRGVVRGGGGGGCNLFRW